MSKERKDSYCTLFDSNYLDKGLVMLKSLLGVLARSKAEVFVLCMDEKCHNILSEERLPIGLIRIDDFVDEEIRNIKSTRSRAEFCWTCTGKLIRYVFDNSDVDICTYIDADMFFYSDPTVLIDEMIDNKCAVQVMPHRFPGRVKKWIMEKQSGKNCVEFNSFTREKESIDLLNEWIRQCVEECSVSGSGDQKYISEWGKFDYVNVCQNVGAGVAPWNISRYVRKRKDTLDITDRESKRQDKLVFYHFEGVDYITEDVIKVRAKNRAFIIDNNLVDDLYGNYLVDIAMIKKYLLEKYDLKVLYTHRGNLGNEETKTTRQRWLALFKGGIAETMFRIYNIVLSGLRKKKTIYNLNELLDTYEGYLK